MKKNKMSLKLKIKNIVNWWTNLKIKIKNIKLI